MQIEENTQIDQKQALAAELDMASLPKFIKALFLMVSDPETDHIICWADKAQGFRILNKEAFEDVLLPKYFQHKEFKSFHRQLNMYNFQKITLKEEEFMEFYHPFFDRNRPQMLERVVRQTSKLFRSNQELRMLTINL